MEFLDRLIVACAHGIGRVGMFLATIWVYFITLAMLALVAAGLWWLIR